MQFDQLTIRQALRRATDDLHTGLDAALGGLDLTDREQYATFLTVQLAARRPIEQWLAANAPAELRPPAQSALLADDLAGLGFTPTASALAEFSAPKGGALGVAWAIGGSSMGNRMMLRAWRQRSADMPATFLADDRMCAFFAALRPTIERPANEYADLAQAIAAARAVFAHFAESFDANASEWEQAA